MTETGNSDLNLTITDVKYTPPPKERVTFEATIHAGQGSAVMLNMPEYQAFWDTVGLHADATVTVTVTWTPAAETSTAP